jgi:hypothetical protein
MFADKNTAPIINSNACINVNNSLFFILIFLFYLLPFTRISCFYFGFFTGFAVGFAGFTGFAGLTPQPGHSQQSPHPILTSF